MQNRKTLTLGLLNYEGDVLKGHRQGNVFTVTDQWKQHLGTFTLNDMEDFINGKISITDSRGKTWKYTEHPQDAKPKTHLLADFLRDE